MKFAHIKRIGLLAGIALTLVPFGVYADESHMNQALKHTKTAVKAADAKTIAEHAEIAKTHAKAVIEHLNASIINLDGAIEHGKSAHKELAKKAAEAALADLEAAQ